MPTFMTKFSYTRETWQKLVQHPEDRSIPLRTLMEGLGGRLIGMYFSMGEGDGLLISEMPDAQAVTTAMLAARLPGHVARLETTQLFTVSEALEIMGKAGRIAFQVPKG